MAGHTWSADFPTLNPFQGTFQGEIFDAFVAKLIPGIPNCCTLPGDFDGNSEINIVDLTTTVNWMFKGGADPACLNDADVNGDCDVNVVDLTYRVNYMFKGGPDLVCGCVE